MSAAGFQTPSTLLHVRTSQCSKPIAEEENNDGNPTIRAYVPRTTAFIGPLSAPAMAREPSGGQPPGRRGTTGRKLSPAHLGLEAPPMAQYDDSQRSSDDEADGDLTQLSERFQKVQQDHELAETQILEEEKDFENALKHLESRRDELKHKLKERDEVSNELKKQIHRLEGQNRAAQSERAKKERLLQQKENSHKKRRDEMSVWDERISSMTEEMAGIETQKAAIERRTASEIREIRQKIEDEVKETSLLEEENKEKALQIKALEEERTRLNEDEETEESREADRLDRERDQRWHEKVNHLNATYTALYHAVAQAKQQFAIARERLAWYENARQVHVPGPYVPMAPLDMDAIRKGMKPRRTRQRGSLASNISSPTSNYPGLEPFPSVGTYNAPTSTSPTFTGSTYFNPKNGMTFIPLPDSPAPAIEEADSLTGGAPMSPRADALLPANLLGDESADDEADDDVAMPSQPSAIETKSLPFPGLGPPAQFGDGPAQHSPSPVSSSSRSFSSPRGSSFNVMDSDRRSIQSNRLTASQDGPVENPQSASRKLVSGLFSFSRQRGKTMADEPPTLGSLKQGQSQSFPRNLDDGLDPIAAQRRRRLSYGGNWAFPANLLPRNSAAAGTGKDSNSARLVSSRRGFPSLFSGLGKSSPPVVGYDPFSIRNDSLDPSVIGSIRGDGSSSRPSSLYSFDKLPRPSVDSQLRAWGPERSNLRGTPLVPDWGSSQSWSRNHSRRPSVQYESTSNLSLGAPPDEDFLEPARETPRAVQAPIGTRPTSSQRPGSPKLNPAAPAFTTLFSKRAEKKADKTKSKDAAKERFTAESFQEDASPPDSRKSKDAQSLTTTGSLAEPRESLERTASAQSGGTPAETTPSKETFIQKLITRKASSSKFNSWKEKGGIFSRKGESTTPGEIDEDGASSDQQFGRSMESTSTTPSGEKERDDRPKANRTSLSWSFMRKGRRGQRDDLTASEVSESSEKASEVDDDDILEEDENQYP